SFEDARRRLISLSGLQQGEGIVGEAGAAISGSCVEEFRTDAVVETDPPGDVLDVRADRFAEVRNLVDEGDLGREEGVRRIFDQLGGPPAGEQKRRLVEVQRTVDFAHYLGGIVVFGAEND